MRCTIIGARRSGLAAALLANRLGYSVFVSEYAPRQSCPEAETFAEHGIEVEFGGHTLERVIDSDLIICSPGVPPTAPVLMEASARSIPIIGEMEFGSRFAQAPIVAITGTNGKTTTTALTAHILEHAGYSAIACGNIGLPLSQVVHEDFDAQPPRRVYVVEASSYQLAQTETFHPRVAVILNITTDHLQYHGTLENYVHAKWKIFQQQTANDVLILCADDPYAAEASRYARSRIEWFSMHPVAAGMYARASDRSIIIVRSTQEIKLMSYAELPLRGVHNVYNSMAAALAARAFEVTNEDLRESLLSFTGVEHRLEHVRILRGVEYINDSKATNINATWYALQAFEQPLVLILGGQADSNDYTVLDDLVRQRCRCIICYGQEGQTIFNHFCTAVRCYRTDSLWEAVECAHSVAEEGDIVLFSPACKSFDQFINYEHRGQVFKEIVNSLPD